MTDDAGGRGLDDIAAEMHAVLRPSVDHEEVLGLTWLVAVDGEVRGGALGHLDSARERPVEVDTIFRISSMTKPITAIAALMLVEDGAIALDDPVDAWLPELADRRVLSSPSAEIDDTVPAARAITLEDLLTFRLGLGTDFTDWSPTPIDVALGALGLGAGPPAPAMPPCPDEWIRRLGTVPLQHQPGERWLYHMGADVLGVLIGRVAGAPFEQVLAERVFEPLGLRDTAFFVPADRLDRFGACFTADDSGARAVYDPVDGQWSEPPAFAGGGAGLVSTAADYHRVTDMLRRGDSRGGTAGAAADMGHGPVLLSPASIRAMTSNHLTDAQLASGGPEPDASGGWGFGVGVQLSSDGPLAPGSYGWDGGLGSMWRTDPSRGVEGILLTNQMWTSPVPPPVCESFLRALRAD